jgi:hypothetical protein
MHLGSQRLEVEAPRSGEVELRERDVAAAVEDARHRPLITGRQGQLCALTEQIVGRCDVAARELELSEVVERQASEPVVTDPARDG